MKGFKSIVVIAAIVGTALAVGACRKEVEAHPMKLGADVATTTVVK